MPTISVLPIRLYRVTAEFLTLGEKEFYGRVAALLFPASEAQPVVQFPTLTTPLDHQRCSRSNEVSEALSLGFVRSSSKVDCLIVDLTNPPYRLLPDHHILGGLLDFLGKEVYCQPGCAIPVVLLMPIILIETDIAMRALKPYLDDGRIGLIADDGAVSGGWIALQSVRRDDYSEALKKIRQDTKARLAQKMIRQPGHFKRTRSDGTHDHCLPFFFDGRFCQKELIELIGQYVAGAKDEDGLPTILYHCPESRWLYDAVMAVCQTARVEAIDVDALDKTPNAPLSVPSNCVLVVPLIDTLRTVKRLMAAILSRSPTARISILSVITTDQAFGDSGAVHIDITGTRYEISYLLRANRSPMTSGNCPACRMDLDATKPDSDGRYLKLTSYNLWTMFLEAGTKPEADVPDTRPSIGQVPDLLSVLKNNSPYLAFKINTMLRALGQLPADPIILHPGEDGARALAASLSSLYSYTTIEVPQELLRSRLPEHNGELVKWRASVVADHERNNARWVTELASLERRGGIRIVLMDEFNRSGGTRSKLERIARAFALEVWCYFCFVDFQSASDRRPAYPHLSLYDLDPDLAQ
ncbi:MAG: hypothetical protein FD157_1254 [Rhodocyclaceae bacterium]|nr:MAG: hypothetical protein FD157_1254 [Rhodocyclaceae bacterium]TND02753.1 MAG: hypothetical protein FD118_1779 [Rhodocyclaceae bacterium]